MGFVVGVVVGRGGCGGVWWEDLSLFEKPFDAVFPLTWGKAERDCEDKLISSFLTTKAASVRNSKGAATVSWCRGF